MKYSVTKHAISRFKERFPKRSNHLVDAEVLSTMIGMLKKTIDERSFLNDTRTMLMFYEKYGYERNYSFLRNDDVVFICIPHETRANTKVVLTCVNYATCNLARRIKYRKKKKEDEILLDFSYDF